MLSDGYRIRKATRDDTRSIMRLLDKVTDWLATQGTDQWQNSHERRRALIDTDIADGRIWVIHDRDRLVATVSVDELADADFWTHDDGPERAVYVHRMAVARSHTGLQLGSAMLDWSADIAQEQRRELVRFDA